MVFLGVARANTAVVVSPKTFLQPLRTPCFVVQQELHELGGGRTRKGGDGAVQGAAHVGADGAVITGRAMAASPPPSQAFWTSVTTSQEWAQQLR
jgi:hypothetical protein